MKRKKRFTQIVLVEFDNSGPYLAKFTSNKPITIEAVAAFYIEREGFNEDRDSLTFVEVGETIKI